MSYITEAQGLQSTESYRKTQEKSKTSKSSYGNTIGEPELSDKAKEYYAQLKQKYSNMDFILVSKDKKEEAQANAGKYANANRMVVLIDEEKIERMATDEKYRKQYESIISGATSQLSQLKSSLGGAASSVKTYGMQVKEGTASFFAVIDKSLAAQKKRIEKNAAKKAEAKKAEAKKEAKKAAEEKRAESKKKTEAAEDEDTITVTANSLEELIRKINDVIYSGMSDNVRTEQEKQVGQHFDSRW